MNTRNPRRCHSSAFTLIELLVVIGLIGLLAGGLGVAMKNKNPATGLRSAQSILVSLLSSTRGQAALNQVNAMILVQADPNKDNFLRSVRVVVQTASGATTWQEVGGEVVLPEGIYIVPPLNNMAGVTLKSGDSKRLSLFVDPNIVTESLLGSLVTAGSYFKSLYLTQLGSVSNTLGVVPTGGRMLVAAGEQTGPNAWTLYNDSSIRGFAVSKYGVATLINDVDSFDVAAP
jgi:prepilin-type N-terminal cleavage/methylation domain-containing protein